MDVTNLDSVIYYYFYYWEEQNNNKKVISDIIFKQGVKGFINKNKYSFCVEMC